MGEKKISKAQASPQKHWNKKMNSKSKNSLFYPSEELPVKARWDRVSLLNCVASDPHTYCSGFSWRLLRSWWRLEPWEGDVFVKKDWTNLQQTVCRVELFEPGFHTNCTRTAFFFFYLLLDETGSRTDLFSMTEKGKKHRLVKPKHPS